MTTYYVSQGGNNGNGLSLANAKTTIAAGIALLSGGDTLLINSGTYTEAGDFNPPSGGSWATATVVGPVSGATVVVRPASGNRVFDFIAKSYIKVEGGNTLILDAVNCSYDAIKIDDDGGGNFSHHIRIANCEIKNAKGNGILSNGPHPAAGLGGFNQFVGNNIHNCATFDFGPFGHAIYISSGNNLIELNTLHDCNSDTAHNTLGVHIYNSGFGGLDSNIVRRNFIYNMTRGGGILVADGTSSQVYDNIIKGCYQGITAYTSSVSPLIANNTVYGSTLAGVEIKGANVQLINNILYLNGTNLLHTSGSYTNTTNLIGVNPLFVDPANGDFHLQPTSPAINAGTDLTSYGFNTDFYGNVR